jgi:cytochrome P450
MTGTVPVTATPPPPSEPAARYPFTPADPFLPPAEYARLRVEAPVAVARVASGDQVWLVTRYEDVRAAYCDPRFSRNLDRPDAAQLLPGVRMLSSPFADPPAHTRWRKLVSKAFTARQVESLRPAVQDLVDGLLDRVEEHGAPADLVRLFCFPLPIGAVCALLGVADEAHAPFRAHADAALSLTDSTPEQKRAAFVAMDTYARQFVAQKRARPGDDLLSRLIAVHDDDAGRLSEDELAATVLTLLIGGYENTSQQLGRGVLALFRHPDQLAALRADGSLIGPAVEEIMRYASADSGYGSPRYAAEDVPLGGTVIPKGATVLLLRHSANHDGAAFDRPDEFDLGRGANPHLAFGAGAHHCLGAALARLELQVGFGALLRRFPGLRLAVPPAEIRWSFRVTAAGPASLPVAW